MRPMGYTCRGAGRALLAALPPLPLLPPSLPLPFAADQQGAVVAVWRVVSALAQRKEDKDKQKKEEDDEWSDPTKIDESTLSEEDLALKQNMDMLVERVMEPVRRAPPRLPPTCRLRQPAESVAL